MWFNAEGEQRLKDSYTTDDTLVYNEEAMQHFDLFLAQLKVLQPSSKTGLKISVFSLFGFLCVPAHTNSLPVFCQRLKYDCCLLLSVCSRLGNPQEKKSHLSC